jgi:hypothetical protein
MDSMGAGPPPPQFLLFVRERLRAGVEAAYDGNERLIAAACATLGCPHPYLALVPTGEPREVWWLNAAASDAEKDGLGAAYASNTPLMAALGPLGKRKQDFRETLTSDLLTYRSGLSHGAGLRLAGARFLILSAPPDDASSPVAVYVSGGGDRLAVRTAGAGDSAGELAARLGATALVLAVQPRWSFPAEDWVAADPDFWRP